MMFDWLLACFGLSLSICLCSGIMTFAFACAEELKKAFVGAVFFAISVAIACGFGGAIWG